MVYLRIYIKSDPSLCIHVLKIHKLCLFFSRSEISTPGHQLPSSWWQTCSTWTWKAFWRVPPIHFTAGGCCHCSLGSGQPVCDSLNISESLWGSWLLCTRQKACLVQGWWWSQTLVRLMVLGRQWWKLMDRLVEGVVTCTLLWWSNVGPNKWEGESIVVFTVLFMSNQ